MTLPSKELLSAVIDKKVYWSDMNVLNELVVHYNQERYMSDCKAFNIYELMHMMKEWAMSEHFYVVNSFTNQDGWWFSTCQLISGNLSSSEKKWVEEDTEFEAVTKACEWILKETK